MEAFVRWREEEVQPHYSVDRTTHRTTSLFLRSAPELSSFIEGATQRLEGREKITKRVHQKNPIKEEKRRVGLLLWLFPSELLMSCDSSSEHHVSLAADGDAGTALT